MKKTQSLEDAIRKTLLSTAAGVGGDFIPTPLSREFIRFIRDKNFLRQLFDVRFMTAKTLSVPKILGKTKVYYQPTEGGNADKSNFTTGTLQLEAKKFMSEVDISEEVIEDAQENMIGLIKEDFAGGIAEAEEEAMLVGDPDHSPTTATESLADDTTWFTRDHKMIYYGLLTLAADIAGSIADDTRAANRVSAGSADMTTAIVREAKYNLGKFGRVMSDLILILNPWSVNQLLDDPKLVTLEKYGPNATIFTGEIGKLYGKVTVIESPFMTNGYGLITHRANPVIGDRRRISIKADDVITNDTKIFVVTERLDFMVRYKGALCQIYGLDEPSTAS